MKLYNPFRAHIVEFHCGRYGIRRITPFGWIYLDLTEKRNRWWPWFIENPDLNRWCKINSSQQVLERYRDVRNRRFRNRFQKTRIVTDDQLARRAAHDQLRGEQS